MKLKREFFGLKNSISKMHHVNWSQMNCAKLSIEIFKPDKIELISNSDDGLKTDRFIFDEKSGAIVTQTNTA